jgi:glutamate synthase domain-containing protein 1
MQAPGRETEKLEASMCGIVGFLEKRSGTGPATAPTILALLQALGCRGPDSAGVALFGSPQDFWTVQVKLPEHHEPATATNAVLQALHKTATGPRHEVVGAYLRLELDAATDVTGLEDALLAQVPDCEVVSLGRRLQIVKQVGSPEQLEKTYGFARWPATHGIGHTRLSTESRVDLSHSQPFWAHGVPDLATAHNGHITNYHKLRRQYEQRGYHFITENDSEVIGIYLRDRLAAGLSLEDALRSSLDDFDGSFSYLAASGDCLAYVKDRFGFKPLVVAETDEWVAIATEEIALRKALGEDFVAREPAPGSMQVWPVPTTSAVPTR